VDRPDTVARLASATLLLAATLFGPSGPVAAAQVETSAGAIRGRVIDARTLRPVGDAPVTVTGGGDRERRAATDADGRYAVDDLAEGLYVVVVEGSGCLTAVQADVRVVRRKVTVVDFELVEVDEFRETVVVSARGAADRRWSRTSCSYARATRPAARERHSPTRPGRTRRRRPRRSASGS